MRTQKKQEFLLAWASRDHAGRRRRAVAGVLPPHVHPVGADNHAGREQEIVLPRSPMAQAIGYTLNQWDALCRYYEHGWLNVDNNAA